MRFPWRASDTTVPATSIHQQYSCGKSEKLFDSWIRKHSNIALTPEPMSDYWPGAIQDTFGGNLLSNPRVATMKRWKWPVCLLGMSVVFALGTACNKRGGSVELSSGRTMPAEEDASKWPIRDVLSEDFQVSVPPSWWQLDVHPSSFEVSAQQAVKRNPKVANLLNNLRQFVGDGMCFYALDESTLDNTLATHIIISRRPLPPGGNLDYIVGKTLADTDRSALKSLTHERLRLPGGERERIFLESEVTLPNGQRLTMSVMQFLLVRKYDGYSILLKTTADQQRKYYSVFDKIGRSFRFKN